MSSLSHLFGIISSDSHQYLTYWHVGVSGGFEDMGKTQNLSRFLCLSEPRISFQNRALPFHTYVDPVHQGYRCVLGRW